MACFAACGGAGGGSGNGGTGGSGGSGGGASGGTGGAGGGAVASYTKTLINNNDCTVKITGVDPNGFYGYTLDVYLENKTNTTLMFAVDDVSVNGYMCDPYFAETVAAGKKSNTEISWFESDFEDSGITTVNTIEFTLKVYDDDNWDAAYLVEQTFTLYPTV